MEKVFILEMISHVISFREEILHKEMWARKNRKELVTAAGGICISEDWDGGGLRN